MDALRALPYAGVVEDDQETRDGVVLYDVKRSYPGYNLVTSRVLSRIDLIDQHGEVIRTWSRPNNKRIDNAELLDNGDLLIVGAQSREPDERAGRFGNSYVLRMNWAGDVLWKTMLSSHHDVELTPRGRILTLIRERRLVPAVHPTIEVRLNSLALLDQSGTAISTLPIYDVVSARPELFVLQQIQATKAPRIDELSIDLFHCNSIEWIDHPDLIGTHRIYGPDNIVVCSRAQDRVFIIDWRRKELLWSWGEGQLSGPHDAQVLENGNILLFDNGLWRSWSRVIELNPISRKIVWQYLAPLPIDFYSKSMGSAQRLPNGNTLIANSESGEAFEVTTEGEIVWRFLNPNRDDKGRRATIVRIKRYEREMIDKLLERDAESTDAATP